MLIPEADKRKKVYQKATYAVCKKNYDHWVKSINFCDVITINTDNLDYTSDALHRARVIEHLSKYLVDP